MCLHGHMRMAALAHAGRAGPLTLRYDIEYIVRTKGRSVSMSACT
jgi:hypothetical protein